MAAVQFPQSGGSAKIPRERAHVGAVVDAVLDSGSFCGEQVIVWRISGQRNLLCDQCGPPHGLLFGNGRDRTDSGSDKADECDLRVSRIYDVSDVSI